MQSRIRVATSSGALAQALDRVPADLEVLAGLDQGDVDRPAQLGEIVADHLHLVAETAQEHAAGASVSRLVPLRVQGDHDCS